MTDPQRHRLLQGFDRKAPVEEANTPPSSWYTDRDFLALEHEHVFQHAWFPGLRRTAISEAGSYESGCQYGHPWVALRDDSLTPRALHNVCRHKGREVVVGSGRADSLVCGYHAWAYELSGRLKSAPKTSGIKGFDRESLSLPEMGLEAWGPWFMLNIDPQAMSIFERHANLTAMLERTGWRELRFHSAKTWQIECNWKVYVDNYLDGGYHIPHMHKSLNAQLQMESYSTETVDHAVIQRSGAGAQDARVGEGPLYIWVFPNLMLNRYGPCLDTNFVVPDGPDRCIVHYEFYFQDLGTDASAFVESSIAESDAIQVEDIEICESVQRGLKSTSYDRGRYAPHLEHGDHYFHQLLAQELRKYR